MEQRTQSIGVRVNAEEMGVLTRAAEMDGRKVADWLRRVGMAAAAEMLVGGRVPVSEATDKVVEGEPEQAVVLPKAEAHPVGVVAMASASKAGTGLDPGEFLKSHPAKIKVSGVVDDGDKLPWEEEATRPWYPELVKLQKKGEFEDVSEDFAALIGGPFKPPKGWMTWTLEKRGRYLDDKHPLAVK